MKAIFTTLLILLLGFVASTQNSYQKLQELGDTVAVSMIYWIGFSHETYNSAALDSLVTYLKTHPAHVILYENYTDQRGNDAYNLRSSQRRANTETEYLVSKGAKPSQIISIGKGETKPVIDCSNRKCSDTEHRLNRRSVVTLLTTKDTFQRAILNSLMTELVHQNDSTDIQIYFDGGNLYPESLGRLEALAAFMYMNPSTKFEIVSTTDCRGSNDYNKKLSQRRAENIQQYLLREMHADTSQFAAYGVGEQRPVLPKCCGQECTDEEHRLNRRTTVRIVGKD